MKHLKTQQQMNEESENLNISDVSVSDITNGFKFKMNGEDLIIVKDYEKDGQDIKLMFSKLGDFRSSNCMDILENDVKSSLELRFEVKPQVHFVLDKNGKLVDADKLLKENNLLWKDPEKIFYEKTGEKTGEKNTREIRFTKDRTKNN